MASTNFVDYSNATPITAAWLNDVNRLQYTILGNPVTSADINNVLGIVNAAHAGGTADAITATYTTPPTAFVDGLVYYVRATSANATATPTFTPNSGVLAATAIVKGNGVVLAPGDIAGAGHWLALQYDTTLTKWILLNPATGTSVPSILGAFRNLQASATGLSATVSVTADEIVVESSTNLYQTLRAVSLSINTAASGTNGLDTGTLAATTWYSVWVIYNSTSLAVAGLISASATAPTLPAGYTHKSRVGWIRTDGTVNKYPLSFKQYGKKVQYVPAAGSNLTGLPQITSGTTGQASQTSPTWVSTGVANFVPTTAGRISVVLRGAGGSPQVAPNNTYGGQDSSTNPTPISIAYSASSYFESKSGEFSLESSNIYYSSNSTSSILFCFGWEDNL